MWLCFGGFGGNMATYIAPEPSEVIMIGKIGFGIALSVAVSSAAAQEVGGHYLAKGTNLDGTIYEGEAQVTWTSKATCEVVWKTGGST